MSHSHEQEHTHDHDHEGHTHGIEEELSSGGKFIASIIITSVTLVAEVLGGIFTGSLALLSDAAHVFLDIFALALGYIAIRMAMKPASSQHTYGFRRMKVLAAFINGATLLVVSIEILREAITRFFHPAPVIAGPMLIIAIIGLVANLLVALVLRGHSHGDLNTQAAFLHVLGDALSSVGVIIAGVIMLITGWTWVDPAAGVLIAIVILAGAGRVLKEATHILNEGSPDGAEAESVSAELAKIPGIVGVHDLHLWAIEPGYPVMSAHILLDDQNLSATELIMNKVKEVVSKKFKIEHTTIQFECSSCGQGQIVYDSTKKA